MNLLFWVQKTPQKRGMEINQEEASASTFPKNMDHFTFCTQSFKFSPLTRKTTKTSDNHQQETPVLGCI